MLAGFYKENKVNEKEVIITTIISPLPIILGESVFKGSTAIGCIILGYKLGLIYVSLNVISGFLQALIGILYANIFFKRRKIEITNNNEEKLVFNREVIIKGVKKSLKILKKVIPMIVVFTLLINFLIKLGLMDVVRNLFSPSI